MYCYFEVFTFTLVNERVEVYSDLLVRYQSTKSICSGQVCCWRQVNLQELSLQKEENVDEFDECHECENDKIKMVDLIKEIHVTVKRGTKIVSRE